MSYFDLIKTIHIFSVSMMVGATMSNGLLHALVLKQNQSATAPTILSAIMQVNRLIMAPSFVGIVVTGLIMVFDVGYGLGETWLLWSLVLTGALIVGFVLGYVLEGRLEHVAQRAQDVGAVTLPADYWSTFRKAAPIGSGAALASLALIYLMIARPV